MSNQAEGCDESDYVSLSAHLKEQAIDSDLARLIQLVADKSKVVQRAFVTHACLSDTDNIYGEKQMELDKYADQVFLDAMEKSALVKAFASEEQDDVLGIRKAKGEFGVTIDPLDGSSLIEANLAVGTIIGFFNEGNVMEKGKLMDASLIVLYGPITSLVYTAKKGVHMFVLNNKGEFELRKENIKIPTGKTYAMGGLRKDWTPQHTAFVENLEKEGYKNRFSGSFSADLQQILVNGGVFSYPALVNKPTGKLRLVFEGNPIALLAKQAGGLGTDGIRDLHEIEPEGLNHRVPIYVGGKKEIELAGKFLR